MRRAARRLGRLERDAGLLALLGIVCFAVAGASAAPAPARFQLSVTGTARQGWDHTGGPTFEGECQRSLRSVGTRTVRFHTSQPAVVRIADARIFPAEVRRVVGTVTLTGPNTVNEVCGGTESHTVQPCAKSTRSFAGGTVSLYSTRPGSITLRPVRNVTLRRINCPREPDEVVASPFGPVPRPLRVSPALVGNQRITRITLTASASRRKTYGQPEAGNLHESASWTLTFTRLQP